MFTLQSHNFWLKNPKILAQKREEDEKFSFRRELYEFLNITVCHCYRHLAQVNRSYLERFMWGIIHIIAAGSLIFLTTSSYESFALNPLITTLYDTVYPISEIPFPAVTLCSNNRISKREAQNYARKLSEGDPHRRSEDYFLKEIIFLGRIYEFETENEHLVTAFQQFIDRTSASKELANVSASMSFANLIKKLTPRCEDLLVKCFFKSKQYKCMMPYQMMEERRSARGFCCSFNYETRYDNNPLNIPAYSDVTGPDMGLILVVDNAKDDYFYNIFNTIGFSIQIHSPNEFPDPASGSAVEKFVGPGQEVFVRVDATSITSTRDILGYSAEKRQCLFADENHLYNGDYTRSECILNCKIRSVKALCDCIPFNYPPLKIVSDSFKICSLQHVPCLNKYKLKWATIMSELISIPGLEHEMEESLLCRECYPSCSDYKYRVTTSTLPLVVNKRAGFGITNGIDDISDVSVIRVFFGQRETWQFKQDVSFYWFEIFSNIGGLCGVVGGFSLISFTEIFYFVIKQIVLFFLRKFNVKLRSSTLQIYP